MPGPTGVLALDKPPGITSHGVVAVIRRTLRTRKVGHAGTLDPMATGLLLIGVGSATRLLGYLARSDKEYLATVRLGAATVTDDAAGEVRYRADPARVNALQSAHVHSAIDRLSGQILQVPSAVSAIKVSGTRSYARVRAGEEVSLAARPVEVTAFDVLAERAGDGWLELDVRVACSTGTYIRALARDLGEDLQVGGHLTRLRRTRIGSWQVSDAIDLDALQADPAPLNYLVGLGKAAAASLPVQVVDESLASHVRHGRPIPWPTQAPASTGGMDAPIAIMDSNGSLLALAHRDGTQARYLAVLAT